MYACMYVCVCVTLCACIGIFYTFIYSYRISVYMDFSYISKILTTDIFEINAQDKTNMVTDMIMDTYKHTRVRACVCMRVCV